VARQAGVLSPNDVRREEGWPASSDPTANSIELPVAGGKPAERAPTNRRHRHRRPATTAATRSRASTNGGQPMAETEPEVDLASPEFTPIRGELARAFLKHRVSIGLGDASDESILDHVDDHTGAGRADETRHRDRRPPVAAASHLVARVGLCPEQQQIRATARRVKPSPRWIRTSPSREHRRSIRCRGLRLCRRKSDRRVAHHG
jgi:hypothetical protein